ncbi:MAG: restriction endonuclease subunit S [Salibacteraceae bacterium]
MKNKNNKALVPELRFPEFQGAGEWKRSKLSSLAKPVKEKAAKLDPEDVLTLSGEHGLVRQTEYFGKKIAGTDLKRYLRIEQDDFVYNDRTTNAAKYGSLKRLTKYHRGAVSPIYKCFRFRKEENPMFWEHYFDAGAHETQLGEFVNEGARAGRFNISVDTFLSISVCYPTDTEQQKIADCLGSLDDLIAAHSQKFDALQDHKKGLLQQLFPAEGKTIPALRFPGFADSKEWEPKKIEELASILMGNAFKSADFSKRGIQLVRMGNLYQRDLDLERSPVFLPSHFEQTCSSYILKPKDLLMSMTGTVGKEDYGFVVQIPEECEQLLLNQRVIKITPKREVIKEFLLHLFQSTPFLFNLYSSAGGTKQANLSAVKLKQIEVTCPSPPEQQKIADCLGNLDALVTAQTEQIAALQDYKKGLMQQLFPKPEARTR